MTLTSVYYADNTGLLPKISLCEGLFGGGELNKIFIPSTRCSFYRQMQKYNSHVINCPDCPSEVIETVYTRNQCVKHSLSLQSFLLQFLHASSVSKVL